MKKSKSKLKKGIATLGIAGASLCATGVQASEPYEPQEHDTNDYQDDNKSHIYKKKIPLNTPKEPTIEESSAQRETAPNPTPASETPPAGEPATIENSVEENQPEPEVIPDFQTPPSPTLEQPELAPSNTVSDHQQINDVAAPTQHSTSGYPEWNNNTDFLPGDRVIHNGRIFQAAPNRSDGRWQAPGDANGPWMEIGAHRDMIVNGQLRRVYEWTESRIFAPGTFVIYGDRIYEAVRHDGNRGISPGLAAGWGQYDRWKDHGPIDKGAVGVTPELPTINPEEDDYENHDFESESGINHEIPEVDPDNDHHFEGESGINNDVPTVEVPDYDYDDLEVEGMTPEVPVLEGEDDYENHEFEGEYGINNDVPTVEIPDYDYDDLDVDGMTPELPTINPEEDDYENHDFEGEYDINHDVPTVDPDNDHDFPAKEGITPENELLQIDPEDDYYIIFPDPETTAPTPPTENYPSPESPQQPESTSPTLPSTGAAGLQNLPIIGSLLLGLAAFIKRFRK